MRLVGLAAPFGCKTWSARAHRDITFAPGCFTRAIRRGGVAAYIDHRYSPDYCIGSPRLWQTAEGLCVALDVAAPWRGKIGRAHV